VTTTHCRGDNFQSPDRLYTHERHIIIDNNFVMFFNYNSYGDVVVYVDGACRGNGTRRARAGVGVWFDDYHEL
jgi:hypothetical protein